MLCSLTNITSITFAENIKIKLKFKKNLRNDIETIMTVRMVSIAFKRNKNKITSVQCQKRGISEEFRKDQFRNYEKCSD